jgi:diaminohydroxyphosphoribosylaminopyrimidine deaminase/5-amino-6-(5-phosphoribosylamino)uracil reductase
VDKEFDIRMLRRCLELAALGLGHTAPNPLVGSVVVAPDGTVVGEGYHAAYGQAHAERVALGRAGKLARGATLYVNLEPCSHTGRTPPCADAVIESGVARVVAAMCDPNPLVAGRGIRKLRRAGIAVEVGLLGAAARRLNEIFIHNITTKAPFIALKLAQSRDCKIAAAPGVRTQISGLESIHRAQLLRASHDSILVGVSTVLADNPLLNVRGIPGASQPLRVVLDPCLKTPPGSKLAATANEYPTLIFYDPARASEANVSTLEQAGIELEELRCGRDGLLPLGRVSEILAGRGVTSVLVEGGARVARSYLASGLVNRLHLFTAPVFLGAGALDGIKDFGKLRKPERESLGADSYLTGRLD